MLFQFYESSLILVSFVHQAPFNQAEFSVAIQNAGVYRCAANIWWLDTYWTPQAGIPYNSSAIKSLLTFTEDPLKAIDRMGITVRIDNTSATPATNLTRRIALCIPIEVR